MKRLFCKSCNGISKWLPNFKVMYRWKTLYVLQYVCEKCGTKKDTTFDQWSFDKRLESYGVCIFEDDLECRQQVG